jgi:REP element-mobilizing transposase RayT
MEDEEDNRLPGGPPVRNHPARKAPVIRPGRSTQIFLTVCLSDRPLTDLRVQAILHGTWAVLAFNWQVGRYVLMPDHLHCLCAPGKGPGHGLYRWVAYWKRRTNQLLGPDRALAWQRDCWDTQVRDRDHLSSRWHYIRQNPVRAGLSTRAEAWPYQGEVFPLIWYQA